MNTTTRNARHKPLTPIPHSLKVLKEKYVNSILCRYDRLTIRYYNVKTMPLRRNPELAREGWREATITMYDTYSSTVLH